MDDNAHPHRAGLDDDFLEGENIACMDWPAHTSNLSLTGHVWDSLGK